MKRLILSLFSLSFLAMGIHAQVISFEPSNQLEVSFDNVDLTIYNDLEYHFTVINNTNQKIDLKWVREVPGDCVSSWASQICDNDLCYFDGVSSNYVPNVGLDDPFTLQANESFDNFILHVKPGDQAGCCPYLIHFFDIDNWDDTLATVQVNVSVNTVDCDFTITSAEEKLEAVNVKVFPNPTSNGFSLTENDVVKQISIFNILGRRVKTFSANNGQQYDIAGLADGLYLVGMMNENGEVLRTTRLFKQAVRP